MENVNSVLKPVKISIPGELGYAKIPMVAVASLAHLVGFSDDRIEDIKCAVAEAVVNGIERDYSSTLRPQEVEVIFYITEKSLVIKVKDKGPPLSDFDPELLEHIRQLWLTQRINITFSPIHFADDVKIVTGSDGNEVQLTYYFE
jgi:hypothetical protein